MDRARRDPWAPRRDRAGIALRLEQLTKKVGFDIIIDGNSRGQPRRLFPSKRLPISRVRGKDKDISLPGVAALREAPAEDRVP